MIDDVKIFEATVGLCIEAYRKTKKKSLLDKLLRRK